MKKLFLIVTAFCGICLFSGHGMANVGCVPTSCNESMGDDRLNASTLEISGKARRQAGSCFICEPGFCEDGDIVYTADFSKFAVCRQSPVWVGNDRWLEFTPELCRGIVEDLTAAYNRGNTNGLHKRWKVDGVEYGETQDTLNNSTTTRAGQDICYYYTCSDGMTYNVEKRQCVSDEPEIVVVVPVEEATSPAQTTVTPPANTTTPGTSSNCEARCKGMTGERRSQCVTCCAVSESVAEWRDPKCVCVDSTKVWDVETAQCVTPTPTQPTQPVQPVADYECSASMISQLNVWIDNYPDCVVQINNLIEYCDSDPQASEANSIYAQIQQCVNNAQAAAEAAQATALLQSQNASRQNITSAISTLDGIKSGLKVTVWRDEEGKFNTSRLLSDSIAGVVLGTAGGLITSNVVKKNQVEDGFEDLQCTVGGQAVAGWGDEFRVGIQ